MIAVDAPDRPDGDPRPPAAGAARAERSARGRVKLVGVALSAPAWADELDAWCEGAGLDPPGPATDGVGTTRARPLTVSLVDGPGDGTGVAWLVAGTDDLDAAVARLVGQGRRLITPPETAPEGRVAVLEGPGGVAVRLVEARPGGRLAAMSAAALPAEAYLRRQLVAAGVVLAASFGFIAHLFVRQAPAHQVSFAFLAAAAAVVAGVGGLASYATAAPGGQDDHDRGRVRATRGEAAGAEAGDPVAGWRVWLDGCVVAAGAAAVSGLAVGLASFALLGRPVGFWLLWGWLAAVPATAVAVAGGLGRRRGLLAAARRAHGLDVPLPDPAPLLRRAWLVGALPVGLVDGVANAGLAWAVYRFGATQHVVSSETGGAVIFTGLVSYLAGRQWGRADWSAARVRVPASLALPDRVRLGPQGVVVAVVAELILAGLAAHGLSAHPDPVAAAVFRGLAAAVGGGLCFGVAAVSGALGSEADERESAAGGQR